MIGDDRLISAMIGPQRCNRRTEVYSRVCGFFRPVQQWNRGKKEEYRERKPYVLSREGAKEER